MQRKKQWIFRHGIPLVCVIVTIAVLCINPQWLLGDVIVLAGIGVIVGAWCAQFMRNERALSWIALLQCTALIAAAWVGGVGVVHDVDLFYTKSTVYTILLSGWVVGWLVTAARSMIRTMPEHMRSTSPATRWRRYWPMGIVVLSAVVFTGVNGQGMSFQNDEYYHIEAAEGFLKTGNFVLWDFAKEQPKISEVTGKPIVYDRAFLYTLQVAASIKAFGWSETAARLPSMMWYVLLAGILYVASMRIVGRRDFAVLAALAVIAMDHVMFYGRIVRMYSMTMVLAIGMLIALYALFREWTRPVIFRKRLATWAGIAAVITALAAHIHLVTLMLLPATVIFLTVEAVLSGRSTQTEYPPIVVKRLRYTLIASFIFLVVTVLGLSLTHQAITEYFLGLRHGGNVVYLLYPFQDMGIAALGLAFFVASFIFARNNTLLRYLSVVAISVLYMFVYVVTRYSAPRYVSFILPIIVLLVLFCAFHLLHITLQRCIKEPAAIVATWVLCLLSIIPLALPVTFDMLPMLQMPRYERVHENQYGHNIPAAYTFVRKHIQPGQALITIDFRSYYWQRSDQEVIELPKERQMTLGEFMTLIEQHPNAWVVIPKGKMHHLRQPIQDYLTRRTQEYTINGTNIFIYAFHINE